MHIAQKAETTTCPSCYKRQTVRDVIVDTDRTGGRVETTGILFIKRKGRVWAPGVRAGDAVEVLGELKADVVTHGHVVIGETARWRGDCKAKILIVEDGARIDGGFFCIDPRGELQEPVAQPEPVPEVKPEPVESVSPEAVSTPSEPPTWSGAAI
ncbi:MAG: polymer-forming cytoskeletal protein [Phycisphaerae bacterium]|nr:polymer-forming cytoskeletal protein [Phycisphaerae bacterium]